MNSKASFTVWFRGLRGKLLSMMGIPLAALTIIGVCIYTVTATVVQDISTLTETRVPATSLVADMRIGNNTSARYLWLARAYIHSPKERDKAIEAYKVRAAEFDVAIAEFKKIAMPEEATKIFAPIEPAWNDVHAAMDQAAAQIALGTAEGEAASMELLVGSIAKGMSVISSSTRELNDYMQAGNKNIFASAIAHSREIETIVLWSFMATFAIILVFGTNLVRNLTRTLVGISTRLADASGHVAQAGDQLSTSSQQVSSGNSEAASALQETVASVEEMSSIVKLNADHAKEAAALSSSSTQAAKEGENEIRALISSMEEIQASSRKIEEIINVIDDIAFQTNLLALNAAVEAARAGEQGKGFAVVADAVRSLAGRSAEAAKDITTLIKESGQKTERGSKVADRAGEALKAIVTSIKKVADLNNEIASASVEQAHGISQISKAMNELDSSVQQNASASEEVAASSEEMAGQADVLNNLVDLLYSTVEGKAAQPSEHAVPSKAAMGAPGSAPLKRAA